MDVTVSTNNENKVLGTSLNDAPIMKPPETECVYGRTSENMAEVNTQEDVCIMSEKNYGMPENAASMKKCYIVLEDIQFTPSYRMLTSQAFNRFRDTQDWPSSGSEFQNKHDNEENKNEDRLQSISGVFQDCSSEFQPAKEEAPALEPPVYIYQRFINKYVACRSTWKLWVLPIALGVATAAIYHIFM